MSASARPIIEQRTIEMSKERRSEPRIDSGQLRLVAYDSLTGKLFGSVTNLSNNGLMLLGNGQVDAGGTMQLDLRRAATPEQVIIELAVSINWVKGADTPGSTWIGAQIIGVSEAHAQTLHNLIEEAATGG